MSDNITLPREVAEHLTKMLEECPLIPNADWSERDCAALTALRTALAAEQPKPTKPTKPKQEPVGWQERHIYPNASGWSVWYPCRWRLAHEPLEQLEQSGITYQWRPVYAAIDAAMGDKT